MTPDFSPLPLGMPFYADNVLYHAFDNGNLAYELHGPIEDGPMIYAAVYEAGKEFGIERLGWGTYLVNHVEGGFPQQSWTFLNAPASVDDDSLTAMRSNW